MTNAGSIVIITGVSGSGKTTALRALEDRGYFCIDNLPSVLIQKVIDLGQEGREIGKLAFGIDAREGSYLQELPHVLENIRHINLRLQVLFLDAQDKDLIRRYSETRRKHPLAADGGIIDGIKAERGLLKPVRQLADTIIDTTGLSPHSLKQHVIDYVLGKTQSHKLSVTLLSFGFRNGLPPESDLVFDVRFLPNPHFIPELRDHTGNDQRVSDYVLSFPESQTFLQKVTDLLLFLLPHYVREGKSYLSVAIGCTGGKHRSVAIANAIQDILCRHEKQIRIQHRDLPLYKANDEE